MALKKKATKRRTAAQIRADQKAAKERMFVRLGITNDSLGIKVPQKKWNNRERHLVKVVNEEVKEIGYLKPEPGNPTKLRRVKPKGRKASYYTIIRHQPVEPPTQRMKGIRRVYGSNFRWDRPDRMDEEWESLLEVEGMGEEAAFEKYLDSMRIKPVRIPAGWEIARKD